MNSHAISIKLLTSSTNPAPPKYSFAGRPEGKDSGELVPGPGKYGCPSLKEKYRSTPSASFGSSVRAIDKKFKGQPGPGSYTPIDPNDTTPKFGFGTASRLPVKKVMMGPDPGAYKVSKGLSERSITFAGRRQGKQGTSGPGPGMYENGLKKGYEMTWKSDGNVAIGTGNRPDPFGKNDGPSPGTYEVRQDLGKEFVGSASCPNFSMYSRRKPVRSDATPGPIYPHYTQFT